MQSHERSWRSFGLLLVCLLVLGGLSTLWAPSVEAVLPPRPTVTAPEDDDDDGAEPTPIAAAAQIFLRVTPSDHPYWAVVQWQDAHGRWHDVTGWRGEVKNGEISWWVAEKDFGKGPFRWAIFPPGGQIVDQGNGRFLYRSERDILAVSQPFFLPARASSTVGTYVTVSARQH